MPDTWVAVASALREPLLCGWSQVRQMSLMGTLLPLWSVWHFVFCRFSRLTAGIRKTALF
jgi:hypothetical protein